MLNRVQLIGNLGADPDVRATNSGKQVTEVRLATSYGQGDKKTTEWHRIVAWDKLADVLAKYTRKGSLIYVGGRIQTRSYDDKEGNKKFMTEIIAEDIRLLSGKGDVTAATDAAATDSDLPF